MDHVKFVIDETPYTCWDWELHKKNLEFLDGIDSEYFRYAASSNFPGLDSEDKQRAALSLRLSYSQALEVLFALLCSLVQAPYCVIGWMISYKNPELKSAIRKISKTEKIYSRLKASPVSWPLLAKLIHSNLQLDEEELKWIQEGFGQMWSIFADDYLSEDSYQEYNCVKHGLRTRPGGFYLAIGREDSPGVPAQPEKMQTIAGSDFGTSFFVRETIIDKNRINFRPKHYSRNWDPTHLANGLLMISISINNVICYLRILNGVKPEECRLRVPSDKSAFQEPWKLCLAGTGMKMDTTIKSENITPFSKDDIIASYGADKGGGSK